MAVDPGDEEEWRISDDGQDDVDDGDRVGPVPLAHFSPRPNKIIDHPLNPKTCQQFWSDCEDDLKHIFYIK